MRRIIILAAPALLASCGQAGDGYAFDGAEFERRSQPVTVVEHASLHDLRAAAPDEAHVQGRDLMGFSYLRPDGCEIHVTDLRKSAARSWLGHEMTHCVYGRWHK
ncbi:hypothetical protein AB1K62_14305 [Parasphingorhabdus sp. JC815]|uniref:hypothetical protein n=1 Tax=Parasphingorhabdus sp. JC815 TaxID=3232140 RepID=UPI00345AB3FB